MLRQATLPMLLCVASLACNTSPRLPITTRAIEGQPPHPSVAVRLLALDFDRMEKSDASGFLVSADGLVVTCRHVVAGKRLLGAISADGRKLEVSDVLAEDADADLAILRVTGSGFSFVPLSDREPRAGERAWVVSKQGVTAATVGVRFDDPVVGGLLGFSAPSLRPGASGGVLIDATGAAVGVMRGAVEDDPTQCGAIPVWRLRPLLARTQHEPTPAPDFCSTGTR